jgi:hypothetical protein
MGESKTGGRATNLLTRTIVWLGCRWNCGEVLDSSKNPRPTGWGDQSPNEDDCLAGMPRGRSRVEADEMARRRRGKE